MLIQQIFRGLPSTFRQIGVEPGDSDEVRLQKTLLFFGILMVTGATFMWGLVYLLFNEPMASFISFFYSAVALVTLAFFRLVYRSPLFILSHFSLGLFLPFIQMMVLGGFASSSAVILWSLIIPIGALLVFGTRNARLWWLFYVALVILSGFLQPFLREENNLPAGLVNIFYVMNIVAVSSIALVTIAYFINKKDEVFRLLRVEEQKSESLLLNILPRDIAAILKNESRTIADHFDEASILFADLVGFTPLTAKMAPVEVVNLLNEIFSHFDALVEKYNVEKIRTIGDNYMVASGVPRLRSDHAQVLARLALEMLAYIQERVAKGGEPVSFRIGINSGPVIGGVIGRKKFVYDVWGDAVNIASRMESQGVPDRIQIPRDTYDLIKDEFICEYRGTVYVKGKGEMDTWYLQGKRS